MSFFDDNRKVGLALIIVGIIDIISVLVITAALFYNVISEGSELYSVLAIAIGTAGTLVLGILFIFFGKNVRKGPNDKVAITSGFFRVLGIGAIVTGICAIISFVMLAGSWTTMITGVIGIISGLLYLWASFKVAGGNKNTIGHILWVILLIISLFGIIAGLPAIIELIAGFLIIFTGGLLAIAGLSFMLGGITAICMMFVYAYVFLALFSPEVKKSMGVE